MQQTATSKVRRATRDKRAQKSAVRRVVNLRLLISSVVIASLAAVLGYAWYQHRYTQVATLLVQRAATFEKDHEWQDAARYLERYLQLKPDDLGARVRVIEASEHSAQSPRQQHRLLGMLYQTVGLVPERHDLRLKLANQLLQTGDFAEAEAEAKKAEKSPIAKDKREASRVIALSLHARARAGGITSIESAATASAKFLKDHPDDVTLASLTAALYRDHPLNVKVDNAASEADGIMNRLVQSKPKNAEALIARYEYRNRYGLAANSRQDLDEVLAGNDRNVEALLLVADDEIAHGAKENLLVAEQILLNVIKLRPGDPRGHIGLARLCIARNDLPQAVDVLSKYKLQSNTSNFDVEALLAGVLISLNQFDKAANVLKELDQDYRQQLPDLTTDSRIKIENFLRLSHARVDVGRNDFVRASRELNAVIAATGNADVAAGATDRLQAHALLADVCRKMGRIDISVSHWKAIADQSPDFDDARLKAGAAYLELERPTEAIRQLEPCVQSTAASTDAWALLVQAHLQRQLELAPLKRNWSEFRLVLDQAKKKAPQRWELAIAEVTYLQNTDSTKHLAMQGLQAIEKLYADNSVALGRTAICYQKLGATADANRVLASFDKLEPSPIRKASLRAAVYIEQGKSEDALQLLSSAGDKLSPADRLELQLVRVQLLQANRKLDEAQRAISTLITNSPNDQKPLLLGIDIALKRQDFVAAERWENDLKGLNKADDFDWRFFRARRLIGQFAKLDTHTRSELGLLLESLRTDRPDWYPLIALAGQYAELSGNRRQAIDAYRTSIDLGDRSPETVERLVGALYSDGRYNEANSFLSALTSNQPSNQRFESLAIALAVKENRLAAALEMAKTAMEQGPNDPMHYVWLAHLQSLNGQQKEAEETFRKSLERFPKDARVWSGFFTYLVRSGETDRARRTLEQWGDKLGSDASGKQFILAQGYELLGDTEAAQQHYRAVASSDSNNVNARLRLAKSLLATDVPAAQREFESILKIDASNAEARRNLASLLAVAGNDEDWNRAVRLLEMGPATSSADEVAADDRLRAIFLSRRGHNQNERLENCVAARRLLTTRLNQTNSEHDLDRMLLADIYEREAAIRGDYDLILEARDVLRPLVDREHPSSTYLIAYTQVILHELDRTRQTANKPADVDRRSVLVRDAFLRIDQLEAALRENPSPNNRYAPIAFRVKLALAQNQRENGLKLLNQFAQEELRNATNDTQRGKVLLQLGNLATSGGYHSQAESWYRQLSEIAPNSYMLLAKSLSAQKKYDDAVNVCLQFAAKRPSAEIATVLTQLLSSAGNDKKLEQRVQPTIAAALDANRNNVDLLMSSAVHQVTLDNNDEAIKLFRRVVESQPNNALALNNLATLLAERPNELTEAQAYVKRGIAISGRSPALLDTLATIEIRAGKPEQAVLDLEEAIAGAASDPRYYFHLAVAYQRSKRESDAYKALESANKYGLDGAILTAGDRELLSSLKQKLAIVSAKQL